MIIDELKKNLVLYQKAGDSERLSVLRFFLSQVQNKEIELRPQNQALTDEIVFKVLRKEVKNRKELIDIYQKAGKQEKVEQETKELEILKEFAKYFPFDLEAVPNQRPQ
jgi:uncharacterized protein YqeY